MLVSEKTALYQLLQTTGTTANTNGFAAFFRTGNSDNVPKTFADLVATSRGAAEYKYQQQLTAANGLYSRVFSRGRTLMPMAGYGQGRVMFDPTSKQNIQTYAVFPEYTRYNMQAGQSRTPQQVLANVQCCSDITGLTIAQPSWAASDSAEFDYGRTLRFRSIFLPTININVGNIRLEYQDPTTLVWTRIVAVQGFNDGLNIVARKLRITLNGTTTLSELAFTPYVERGTEFVVAPFTHVVLVPLTLANPTTTASYLSQTVEDYYGIVLDVGTDIKLGTPAIGKYGLMALPDLSIPIADNFVEGV